MINCYKFVSERLENSGKMNLSLHRILEVLNGEQNKLKVIHITGTNGKGSVAHSLSNIYTKAGYKVGVFTSPTPNGEYDKMILLNNEPILYSEMAFYLNKISEKDKHNSLTQFELLTSIAIMYFLDKKVDIAIFEVGLGGRDDATNVFDKKSLNIITNISSEHTNILGDIENAIKIKKGIIKKNDIVLLGKNHVLRKNISGKNVIKPQFNYKIKHITKNKIIFIYKSKTYKLNCGSKAILENILIAIEAVSLLNDMFPVKYMDVYDGLNRFFVVSRYQYLKKNILVDGAHNVEAVRKLVAYLKRIKAKNIKFYIGFLKDKDYENMLNLLLPIGEKFYITNVSNERQLEADILSNMVNDAGVKCSSSVDKEFLLKRACEELLEEELLVVTGSLYLTYDVVNIIKAWSIQ